MLNRAFSRESGCFTATNVQAAKGYRPEFALDRIYRPYKLKLPLRNAQFKSTLRSRIISSTLLLALITAPDLDESDIIVRPSRTARGGFD